MHNGQLRRADGMRQVDVQLGEVARGAEDVVLGLGRTAGRVPEVGPVRLVDARARTHNVDVAERLERDVEHVRQRGPRRHVCLDEDGAGAACPFLGGVAVLGDESLCLWPKAEVCEDDVAVAGEEKGGEGEVDTGSCAGTY